MVVLTIMAVLLGIGVPSFKNIALNSKLSSYTNDFIASVNQARSEAFKRNATVSLCASANGTSCSSTGGWEQGWIILFGSTAIAKHEAIQQGFLMSGSVNKIDFDPTGLGATSATITVCSLTPRGDQERSILVSASGRTSVVKTTTGNCP
jgi:type IV fimbrial biogenesis protein FimT